MFTFLALEANLTLTLKAAIFRLVHGLHSAEQSHFIVTFYPES